MNKNNPFAIILAISKKELTDYVRDWRTLLAIVVVPLLMFPAIFFIFPLVMQSELDERQSLELDAIVESNKNESELEYILSQFSNNSLNYSFETFDDKLELNNTELVENDIKNSNVDIILRLYFDSNSSIWEYYIIYDSTQESSGEAYLRISHILNSWEKNMTSERLNEAGLDEDVILNPLRPDSSIQDGDVSTAAEQAGFVFSFIIPVFVTIWTATAGVQPSIDFTAGERERGTLESLLCSPCSRFELLLGKWFAVICIVGVSISLQLAGLIFAISFIMSGNLLQPPDLSLSSMILFLVAITVFAIMVVALEIALAIRSRSVKEAGTILGPMTLFFFLPAIFAQFINLEGIEIIWFLVPGVNVLLAMRELLQNEIIFLHVLVWISSSLIYAGCATWYASRQFLREDLVESIN